MTEINRLFSNMGKIDYNKQLRKADTKKNEPMFQSQGGGFDTVSFSNVKNQNWQDIAKEWREYTDSIWGKPEPNFKSREDREHYSITYYDKY